MSGPSKSPERRSRRQPLAPGASPEEISQRKADAVRFWEKANAANLKDGAVCRCLLLEPSILRQVNYRRPHAREERRN